jgi:hypothetical protein
MTIGTTDWQRKVPQIAIATTPSKCYSLLPPQLLPPSLRSSVPHSADAGESYVFKVHNTADSRPDEQFAEAQNALLGVLSEAQLPVPQVLPLARPSSDASDGFTLRTAADDGSQHAIRLLTWVPGDVLVGVAQSATLYRSLGCLLACVDSVLLRCDLAARFPALRRRFDWNMECLPDTYARIRGDLLGLAGVDMWVAAVRVAGCCCLPHRLLEFRNAHGCLLSARPPIPAASCWTQRSSSLPRRPGWQATSCGAASSTLTRMSATCWCTPRQRRQRQSGSGAGIAGGEAAAAQQPSRSSLA